MDLRGLFDSLYSRFLLKDFLAKMIPGSIFIGTIVAVSSGWHPVVDGIKSLSFGGWFLFAGMSWLTGIGIQGLGERDDVTRGPIRELPPGVSREDFWRQKRVLAGRVSEMEEQTVARSSVIIAATGIGWFSIAVSLTIFFVDAVLERVLLPLIKQSCSPRHSLVQISDAVLTNLAPLAGVILILVGLFKFHTRAIERENAYRQTLLELPPCVPRQPDARNGEDSVSKSSRGSSAQQQGGLVKPAEDEKQDK